MRHAWVNTALLGLLAAQVATGIGGVMTGASSGAWVLWLHALGGYAVLAALVFKGRVIARALRRGPLTPERRAFVGMLGLLVAVLATGLAWVLAGPLALGYLSLINVHAYLALLLAALVVWHVRAHRSGLRARGAADRGAALRWGALAVAGLALWQLERTAQALLGLPGAARRFTGSYERGSWSGRFPSVRWLNDDPAPLAPGAYRLAVDGAVERPLSLDLAALRARGRHTRTETLDCTGGWYTRQVWDGVPLADLLAEAGVQDGARSVRVHSVTGYARSFALPDASAMLVALGVAGEPLRHGHGAPARLVAPGRRGYDWVKWATRIEVRARDERWQPPLPLS